MTETEGKMNKISVSNFHEYLKNQGVGFLTSESCGIGIRGLFDLTARGKELVEMFFSVKADNPNWNSKVGEEPAIASIRIPYDTMRSLCIFALLLNGAEIVFDAQAKDSGKIVYFADHLTAVWSPLGSVRRLTAYKELRETYDDLYDGHYREWENHATGPAGSNEHVFSGRTI